MPHTGINLATLIVLAFLANSCLIIGGTASDTADNTITTTSTNTTTSASSTTTEPPTPPTTTTPLTTSPTPTTTTSAVEAKPDPNTAPDANTTSDPTATENSTLTATTRRTAPPTEQTTPGVTKIFLDQLTVPVKLEIEYTNVTYEAELNDKNSEKYKHTSVDYIRRLSQIYQQVRGFKEVTIDRFWNGSLGIEYTIHVKYKDTNLTVLKDELIDLNRHLDDEKNVDVDLLDSEQRLTKALQTDPCQIPDICPLDSGCVKSEKDVTCTYKCIGMDKCQNGGVCVISQTHEAVCKCLTNDDYIYGGDNCEQKAEKLALSKENIIAIAGGTGGGVVLIFVIIIIVICAKKSSKVRPNDKVKDDASEQSFKDSEDGLHQNYKMSQVSNDVTFRSPGPEQVQMRQNPYTISTSSIQPNTRNPRDIVESYGSDYRFPMVRGPIVAMDTRKQSDAFDMRRQSRVRISEDVENSPDYYNRGPNRSRDSIDATNVRKNSNFNLLAQRRRSSVPADFRGPTFTRNPLYNMRRKSSVYMEIDDNDSKSVMYQPSNNTDYPLRQPMTPTAGKVYDYSNLRRESTAPNAMSPRLRAGSEIWDYDDDNRMYGYKKPVPAPRRYN